MLMQTGPSQRFNNSPLQLGDWLHVVELSMPPSVLFTLPIATGPHFALQGIIELGQDCKCTLETRPKDTSAESTRVPGTWRAFKCKLHFQKLCCDRVVNVLEAHAAKTSNLRELRLQPGRLLLKAERAMQKISRATKRGLDAQFEEMQNKRMALLHEQLDGEAVVNVNPIHGKKEDCFFEKI